MNSSTGLTMADLGFVSVARYLLYVERNADLEEFSLSAIFSFHVGDGRVAALIARKTHLLGILVENNKKLSVWANESGMPPESVEMVILRSIFLQNRGYAKMVQGHIDNAKRLDAYSQGALFVVPNKGEVDEDELPF